MLLPMRAVLLSGLAGAVVVAGCAREPAAPVGIATQPAPAACATCHAEIAREWGDSLHRASYDHPAYQRAFAVEPLPFCTGCHAPRADARDPGPSAAHGVGVDCTSCHGAGHGTTPGERVARAAKAEAQCARCHEFTFPGFPAQMQLTSTEHARSSFANDACGRCHMPAERGHRSHRFAASRDAGMLRSAARITAERTAHGIRVRFAPGRVGHAFPTGDIFRRLHVVVENGAGERTETFLDRKTKQATPDAPNARDDRPFLHGPDPAVVDLAAPSSSLTWRVVYERVEHPAAVDGSAAVLDGAIEVAGGTLEE